MSDDDMFAELGEMEGPFVSPTEFSGVSASGSSLSPPGQPSGQHLQNSPMLGSLELRSRILRSSSKASLSPIRPPVLMSPPTMPSASSDRVVYKCLFCKTSLKTLRGYNSHVVKCKKKAAMDALSGDQQMTVQTELAQTASSSPVFTCPSCGNTVLTLEDFKCHVSKCQPKAGGSSSTKSLNRHPTIATTSTPTNLESKDKGFQCTECNSILKSKSGFMKHRSAHKMKEFNMRRPMPSQELLHRMIEDILHGILLEPKFGEDGAVKIKLINTCIEKKECSEFNQFTTTLADSIIRIAQNPTKVLPINQYEEALQKFNCFLNTNESTLRDQFVAICDRGDTQFGEGLPGRIVFGIATQLLDKVLSWVFKNMRGESEDLPQYQSENRLSESENRGFMVSLGKLIRDFYLKSYSISVKLPFSECLKDTFVDGPKPISKAQFLNKTNWLSGDEDCIMPSIRAVQFFRKVEQEKKTNPEGSAQEVTENLLYDMDLLDIWYYLTSSYFSEDVSLLFMRQLVGAYFKRSSLLQEQQKNRVEEKSVRATTVALRTHLQHNFIDKDDGKGDEEIE